ncbi:MAG: UDP-glucose--dolichyl-phosphate glucosyltransferase [Gemmatimonadaceae bacterium]|nr:UDP-glucose--dolichyl-phosphate glucosyltransferase [Gemmatimonadaceae bacterium]
MAADPLLTSPSQPTAPLHGKVVVIIPALNEEDAILRVLADIPDLADEVIVADNGSTDDTPSRAASAGARVVHEPRRGYGQACLAGIAALPDDAEIIVFLDGDYSDRPDEMGRVVEPIRSGMADLVIGSRVLGEREPGALLPQARFGNALATFLMRLLYGVRYTDLGPFRAIRRDALDRIQMVDRDFGWTVEMQVKAARHGLRGVEVPVSYRRRLAGASKVTGTLSGTVRAGWKILHTIFLHARQ